ncbi:MAG: preprotein translocase subunit SecE [Vicinamibacterales bacterium]
MSTLEQVKPAPVRSSEGGPRGWWSNARGFLTEVHSEMRRVTWPSRKEVYATTVVVILTSAFFGIYLWLLDLGLDRLVNWVLRQFGGA